MTLALPIIDITMDADAPASIGMAARGVGFFYVTGPDLGPSFIDAVLDGLRRFFALAAEVKEHQSIRRSPHNRGYVGMKGESLDPKHPPDLKEAYNIELELAADDPRVMRGDPFRGVNVWPELPGWRETMLAYFDAVWKTGRQLHEGIARDLKLALDYFKDKLDQPMGTLRLLHYHLHMKDLARCAYCAFAGRYRLAVSQKRTKSPAKVRPGPSGFTQTEVQGNL